MGFCHRALLPDEFASQVFEIEIVLAGVFHDVAIRQQVNLLYHRPRPGISLGIIDRNLNIHVPEVFPPKTLHDMRRIRNGLASLIQPALSVEAAGGNDQGVAVPLTG